MELQKDHLTLKKNKTVIIYWTLIVGTILLFLGGIFLLWTKEKQMSNNARIKNLSSQIASLREENEILKSTCQTKNSVNSLANQNEMKTYINSNVKYSFQYPQSFLLSATEEDSSKYDGVFPLENKVALTNNSEAKEKDRVNIYIEVNGTAGPVVADKKYILQENKDGGFEIKSEEFEKVSEFFANMQKNDKEYIICTQTITASNGQRYYFVMRDTERGEDYEDIFKAIIKSVKLFN